MIPRIEAGIIRCVGVCFDIGNESGKRNDFVCCIDDLYVDGAADYTVDFSKEKTERWNWRHVDVSQFTRVKGIFSLENGAAHLSGPDFAEAYTGDVSWRDLSCSFVMIPDVGTDHFVNVRVQGAMRSYAIGFCGGEFCIIKNGKTPKKLDGVKFSFDPGKQYRIDVSLRGDAVTGVLDGKLVVTNKGDDDPLLSGSIGLSCKNGSHTRYISIDVRP